MSAAAALLAALVGLLAAGAAAEGPDARVVAALNQNRISITAGFEGSEIFVFGAISRAAGAEALDPGLGVVVKIVGPSAPLVVRRKTRQFGVWTFSDAMRVDAAPSFYAVGTTGPFYETISHTEDLRHRVSLDHAVRLVDAGADAAGRREFLEAVVRLRRSQGLYLLSPSGVEVVEGTLFRKAFRLPANIVEGEYRAQVFLTRDRRVIDRFETTIDVRKVGLERLIDDLARERPLLYGLIAVLAAAAAGLFAAEAFRWFRR
jgi:uncharacterized protein (TIGR02186 family)